MNQQQAFRAKNYRMTKYIGSHEKITQKRLQTFSKISYEGSPGLGGLTTTPIAA